jgi:hypothetical protein
MREAERPVQHVDGVCGVTGCVPIEMGERPLFKHLSNHCPVVMDVVDQNWDP